MDMPFVPQRFTTTKGIKAFDIDTAICVCNLKATQRDKGPFIFYEQGGGLVGFG